MSPFDLLERVAAGLASRWRNVYFRARGVRFNGYAWLRSIEIPRNHSDIELGAEVGLDRGVTLLASGPPAGKPKLVIGPGTYVNRNTMFDVTDELVIGRDCAIGPACYLTDHDHGIEPGRRPLDLTMHGRPTRLGDRVWLGANVTVLKGVTIGDDAVIGAGSVVTKDIPSRMVAVGVPARVIRAAATNGHKAETQE